MIDKLFTYIVAHRLKRGVADLSFESIVKAIIRTYGHPRYLKAKSQLTHLKEWDDNMLISSLNRKVKSAIFKTIPSGQYFMSASKNLYYAKLAVQTIEVIKQRFYVYSLGNPSFFFELMHNKVMTFDEIYDMFIELLDDEYEDLRFNLIKDVLDLENEWSHLFPFSITQYQRQSVTVPKHFTKIAKGMIKRRKALLLDLIRLGEI